MSGNQKHNKSAVNRIIDSLLEELAADKLLPVGNPNKMSRKDRDKVYDRIERLEAGKIVYHRKVLPPPKRVTVNSSPAADAVKASPTNRTLVPRGVTTSVPVTPAEVENSGPEPGSIAATEFLQKVRSAS